MANGRVEEKYIQHCNWLAQDIVNFFILVYVGYLCHLIDTGWVKKHTSIKVCNLLSFFPTRSGKVIFWITIFWFKLNYYEIIQQYIANPLWIATFSTPKLPFLYTTFSSVFSWKSILINFVQISLMFIPRALIANLPPLHKIMAWCRVCEKQLPESRWPRSITMNLDRRISINRKNCKEWQKCDKMMYKNLINKKSYDCGYAKWKCKTFKSTLKNISEMNMKYHIEDVTIMFSYLYVVLNPQNTTYFSIDSFELEGTAKFVE